MHTRWFKFNIVFFIAAMSLIFVYQNCADTRLIGVDHNQAVSQAPTTTLEPQASPPPQEDPPVVAANPPIYETGETQTYTCGSRSWSLYNISFAGKPYLFRIDSCGFVVYDVSQPSVKQVWGGDPYGPSAAYPHMEFRTRQLAMLNDFPYGFQTQSSEGWGIFKIDYDKTSGKINKIDSVDRFYFGDYHSPEVSAMDNGAKLFKIGSRAYVVGRYLDKENFDLAIHDFGDGTTAPPMTRMSGLDKPHGTQLYEVIQSEKGVFLYAFEKGGVYIYNITVPATPVLIGMNTDEGLSFDVLKTGSGPSLPMGTALVQNRLYTHAHSGYFYIYDVSDPATPTLIRKQQIVNDSGNGISTDGRYLITGASRISGMPLFHLYSVINDQVKEIEHSVKWDASDPVYTYESCQDVALMSTPSGAKRLYKLFVSIFMKTNFSTVDLN